MMDTQLISRLPWKRVSGGEISVQPIVFHRVMHTVQAAGWQVIQRPEGLVVLLRNAREGLADADLVDRLRRELEAQGVVVPPFKVRRLPDVARTALGKAPLIRSATTPQEEAP